MLIDDTLAALSDLTLQPFMHEACWTYVGSKNLGDYGGPHRQGELCRVIANSRYC
jgi:hypothetical protein